MAKVLIADDDPDARLILDRVLRHAGHETFLASNGIEASRVSARVHPAVAIIDIFMPGKDGIETIRELRSMCAATRIIAISAGWTARQFFDVEGEAFDVLKIARDLGADRALGKSLDPDSVCQEVEALLPEGSPRTTGAEADQQ